MSDRRPDARDRILYVGKTHSGKSYALKRRLARWLTLGARIVVMDPCDEYSKLGSKGADNGPLTERITDAELAANPKLIKKARLALSVVPSDDSLKGWARCFLLVSGLLRAAGQSVVFVAEEAGTWSDASAGAHNHKAKIELIGVATNGRHRNISLVIVSQRAAMVPLTARAQLSEIVSFRQDETEDLEALAERIGKEKAEATARLSVGESIEWRDTLTHTPKETPTCSASPVS